jgi:hypothetical protein
LAPFPDLNRNLSLNLVLSVVRGPWSVVEIARWQRRCTAAFRILKKACLRAEIQLCWRTMSTIAEIEVAIERLSPTDQARLRDWLLQRAQNTAPAKPKTGAEIATGGSGRFHLTREEADDLARDLELDRRGQTEPMRI